MLITELHSLQKESHDAVSDMASATLSMLTFPNDVFKTERGRTSAELALRNVEKAFASMRRTHDAIDRIVYSKQKYGAWFVLRRPFFVLQIWLFPFDEFQKEQERDAKTLEYIRGAINARLTS